jgi:hypothetical protein
LYKQIQRFSFRLFITSGRSFAMGNTLPYAVSDAFQSDSTDVLDHEQRPWLARKVLRNEFLDHLRTADFRGGYLDAHLRGEAKRRRQKAILDCDYDIRKTVAFQRHFVLKDIKKKYPHCLGIGEEVSRRGVPQWAAAWWCYNTIG